MPRLTSGSALPGQPSTTHLTAAVCLALVLSSSKVASAENVARDAGAPGAPGPASASGNPSVPPPTPVMSAGDDDAQGEASQAASEGEQGSASGPRQPTAEGSQREAQATGGASGSASPSATPAPAKEGTMKLDDISVTATREERLTLDVPQAIVVVGKDRLDAVSILNVKDALASTPGVLVDSKNGGYDARLIIRGAGLRANYGIREIMFLRDGVPLTDPDSLTRLDWLDTQDIERIEISKGPGNLYSPGSAGGAVQIFSRSVFDNAADGGKISRGSFERWSFHVRSSAHNARGALALSASMRMEDNDWRAWNRFDSKQVSFKQGLILNGTGTLESEVAYTESNIQLPGAMDPTLFQVFEDTGRQLTTSEPWQNSGRYSRIVFANVKLEQPIGNLLLKPRLYYSQWTHRHPVTGVINVTHDWTHIAGTDLELQQRHTTGRLPRTLVVGLTFKAQWNDDIRKYQYQDVSVQNDRIVATLSDAQGALMEQGTQENLLGGVFVQESLQPFHWLILDLGGRLDRMRFGLTQDEAIAYSYASGNYVPGAGHESVSRSMWLPAPKAGLTLKVTEQWSAYLSAAVAYQVPTESELTYNQNLDTARTTAYEVGTKLRSQRLSSDLCVYLMKVNNEIVSYRQNGVTVYENAGATNKRGLEASASLRLLLGIDVGFSYAYSDYTYASFIEQAGQAPADRSGKRLPYVPRHQGSLFASWRHPWGLQVRAETNTWGRYYLDNANSDSYKGYAWLTGVSAMCTRGRHRVALEAQNIFDQRYAAEVTKDTSGRVLYSAGAPRTILVTYQLRGMP